MKGGNDKKKLLAVKKLFDKRINRSDSVQECRLCLEPGIERRCCGNYYCNICYYKFSTCQSCHAKVELGDSATAIQNPTEWERKWTKRLVVGIPVALVLLGVAVFVYHMMLPATVFGLQCAKPFDSNYECYTYDSLLTGTDGRIENWQRCPIEDSNIPRPMGCVCGNVCPVDSCVNSKSGHLAGKDYVEQGFWATRMIMFDDFEDDAVSASNGWANSSGSSLAACGAAHGSRGLRFYGSSSLDRLLMTPTYPLESGGQWQFYLKYSADDGGDCPRVERAIVTMYYSIDGGATWIAMQTFDKKPYYGKFSRVAIEVPKEAWTPSTMFMWKQHDFFHLKEAWVLDNIRLYRHLPLDWRSSARWHTFKANATRELQTTNCCYKCLACKNPRNIPNAEFQCKQRPGLADYVQPNNIAIEFEYVLAIAGACAVVGIIVRLIQVCIRVSLSGVLVCCRPCTHYIARRRIRREYEDKLRTKAFEKAQQLEAARKREEEERRLAAEIEQERTRHLKVSGKELPVVPIPASLLPQEAAGAFGLVPMEEKSSANLESSSEDSGSGSSSDGDDTLTTNQPSVSEVPSITNEASELKDGSTPAVKNSVAQSSPSSRQPSTRRSDTPNSSGQLMSPSGSGSVNTPKAKRGMSSKGLTKGIADHEGLRAAKAMKKAEEEFAKRKAEEEARKQAMETMDAETIAQDEEYQQFAVHRLGTYAAREEDERRERERVENVKAALRGYLDVPPPNFNQSIPWNESRPVYDDENNKMYNDGPYAMAIHFLEQSPAKRRQQQLTPANLKPTTSPSKSGIASPGMAKPSPSPSEKPRKSPISRLLSPKSTPRPSPSVALIGSESKASPLAVPHLLDDGHHDDGDDDSSYHSGDAGEYLDEAEMEEEAIDVNALLRQPGDQQISLEGNLGALSQLYTVDERKRTDVYRPRRSLLWIVLYSVLGLGLPALVAIGILMQMGGAIVQPTLQYRLGIVDYIVPYLYITACAIVTDAYVLMRVALDVMCFTPLTRPSFRMIWAEPSEDEDFLAFIKKSAFVIDGGVLGHRLRVPMNNIRGSSYARKYEPHAIAATYLFVSLPWSVIAIYCPFRYLSLTISVFSICRVFYGPWFVHKLFLIFYEMSATVYVRTEEERDRFAASCCGFRARLVANMMLAFISPIMLGVFAFLLLLIFTGYNKATRDMQKDVDILIPVMVAVALLIPFVTGWMLGCTHNLPVHSLMFVTNLDQGIRVHYYHKRKSEMCESFRCCAGKPGRIPGTGVFAPWVDGFARFCGFMPRNNTHFMLDPNPMQEAVCYVFGVNNAATFKVSLTKQEMLRKMDVGQKILKGIPVEGFTDEAVGAHFYRPAPATVVKQQRSVSSSYKPSASRVTSGSRRSGEVDQHVSDHLQQSLPGSVPTPETLAKKSSLKKKKQQPDEEGAELSERSMGSPNASTTFGQRRKHGKGGGGKLAPPRKPRTRPGRRVQGTVKSPLSRENVLLMNGDDIPSSPGAVDLDGGSLASSSSDDSEQLTPRRRQLASRPTGEPTRSQLFPQPASAGEEKSGRRRSRSSSSSSGSDFGGRDSRAVTNVAIIHGEPSSPTRPPPIAGIPTFTGSFVEAHPELDSPSVQALVGSSLGTSLAILQGRPVTASSQVSGPPPRTPVLPSPDAAKRESYFPKYTIGRQNRTESALDMTAEEELLVFQENQKRVQQRTKEEDTRKLRSKLAAGLAEGVVASPTITRRDEANVLTPFKMVEAAKDAAKQGVPVDSLNAASWGSTTPRSHRLKDRRRAVG